MGQEKKPRDDDLVPLSTWWLLNSTGKLPTWAQLERRVVAARRHMESSNSRKRGQMPNVGGEEGGENEAPGPVESQVQGGGGALRRLMGRLLKRPVKKPLPSDEERTDVELPDTTTQGRGEQGDDGPVGTPQDIQTPNSHDTD